LGPNIVRNFHEINGARVAFVATWTPHVLRNRAKYPSIKTTTSYDLVLKNPKIAAVAIATPVATHYEFARKALEAGKHVLVESPLQCRIRIREPC